MFNFDWKSNEITVVSDILHC